VETIGSKRSYALTWCMPNNDDDDDVEYSFLFPLFSRLLVLSAKTMKFNEITTETKTPNNERTSTHTLLTQM